MNALAANEPAAQDALARLGGGPARTIAAALRRARRHLTPALMGVG